MPSISTPTLAPVKTPKPATRPERVLPSNAGPPCHRVWTSNEIGTPVLSRPISSSASRRAIIDWTSAAPLVASRKAPRTVAAVRSWIRALRSGQSSAGIDPLELVLRVTDHLAHLALERERDPRAERGEFVLEPHGPRGVRLR